MSPFKSFIQIQTQTTTKDGKMYLLKEYLISSFKISQCHQPQSTKEIKSQ